MTFPSFSTPVPPAAVTLARAAITVVARDGFDRLSVRRVAAEAGVAPGTVQHYFPSRSELLAAAFRQTVADIAARTSWPAAGKPLAETLAALLDEALPLDEQRRRESTVWVTLSAAATAHTELAAIHVSAVVRLTDELAELIGEAQQRGELGQQDPRAAAVVLVAVVDGLTLHGITGALTSDDLTGRLRWALEHVLRPT